MPKSTKPKKTKVHKNAEKMIELYGKASKIHRQYRKAYMDYLKQLVKMFESNNEPITKKKKRELIEAEKDFLNDTIIKDTEKFLDKKIKK